MTNMIKKIAVSALVVLTVAGGIGWWHTTEMAKLNQQLQEEQSNKELMEQRIQIIQEKLDTSESEKESLLDQINDLLTEEEVVFDSEALKEEIQEIGELATVEYRYTNAGTLDSVEQIKALGWDIPFSGKTAVVTMDGVIKAGIDVTKVQIIVDEADKTITVELPEATIISNELFEDSLVVYVEEDSLFSDLTLEDGSSLRSDIKSKAEDNALGNGLLEQAHDRAGEIIMCVIEAMPSVADTYEITVK